MRIKTWHAVIVAACLVLTAAPVAPAAAGTGVGARQPAAPEERRVDRKAVRARVAGHLSGHAAPAAAPVHTAADGDALVIADPVGAPHPKGDLRQVQVGGGGGAALRFTVQVEQYSDPLTDTAWTSGFTSVLWVLDTSGDGVSELIIELYNDRSRLVAVVYDRQSDTFVCEAGAESSAVNKTYTAIVTLPGCLGDAKRPAVAAFFVLDDPVIPDFFDVAPNDGSLVRFNRPPAGQPAGGYTIVTRTAGFQRYGAVPLGASVSGTLDDFPGDRPIVAAASARPFEPLLWAVTDDGAVETKDFADWHGDLLDVPLAQPIVGMSVLPHAAGYWLVARDGGIFAFGEARFFGSTGGLPLNQPVVGMASTPSGLGYWLVAADGGIFAFGDARFYGSTGSIALNQPVVGMATGYQGQGYWLVARDGGIFSYGMPFHGSTGSVALQQPIVGMAATRSGGGYRFIARDGGLFGFGDAEFHGSAALPGRADVVGVATA